MQDYTSKFTVQRLTNSQGGQIVEGNHVREGCPSSTHPAPLCRNCSTARTDHSIWKDCGNSVRTSLEAHCPHCALLRRMHRRNFVTNQTLCCLRIRYTEETYSLHTSARVHLSWSQLTAHMRHIDCNRPCDGTVANRCFRANRLTAACQCAGITISILLRLNFNSVNRRIFNFQLVNCVN